MKKLFFILLLFCTAGLIFFKVEFYKKSGIIILLHGPSTAGKSSLKKELQKEYPSPFLNLGIDTLFVGVLPERFVTGPAQPNDINHAEVMHGVVSHDKNNNRLFTLNIGPQGDQVIHGMHRAIEGYARSGNNCIVDYITYKDDWIDDLCNSLKGLTVYTVGIDLPIETLEAREKSRGIEAIIGHARSHWKSVHKLFYQKNGYDIVINNDQLSAKQSADLIVDFIKKNRAPQGFKNLARKESISELVRSLYKRTKTLLLGK